MSRRLSIASRTFSTLLVAASFVGCSGEPGQSVDNMVDDDDPIRIATFNCSLNRSEAGELIADLSSSDNEQAQQVAEVIQRVRPQILLLSEFDYDEGGEALALFQDNYLSLPQSDQQPIAFAHAYAAPSNTGIPSGHDLDNNGEIGGGGDAFGFGMYAGQYSFVVLSTFPIVHDDIRSFRELLWKDMPGASLPDDLDTPEPNDWYSAEELEVVRLSSKNHVDVPIDVGGSIVHVLAHHPTPPAFDGPEDRNGHRNHDEVRLWADYVRPEASGYLVDDAGRAGGLKPGELFVIMGDHNSDPVDGDSRDGSIAQLLDNPDINTDVTPKSEGGAEAAELQGGVNEEQQGDPAFDTGDFYDGKVGNLRLDYVLPSRPMEIVGAGVFWPLSTDPLAHLLKASDHRAVHIDLLVPSGDAGAW